MYEEVIKLIAEKVEDMEKRIEALERRDRPFGPITPLPMIPQVDPLIGPSLPYKIVISDNTAGA